MWKKIKPYVISVVIALATGGISALLSKNGMSYYNEMVIKPPLSPPMWLFPTVWSILYTLMGISSAIIFQKRNLDRDEAIIGLRIYALQLVINFFWSIIFFNFRNYLCAFIWLLLLLFVIVIMILQFRKINSLAAYLQIPYLIWGIFAAYLTWMVNILN